MDSRPNSQQRPKQTSNRSSLLLSPHPLLLNLNENQDMKPTLVITGLPVRISHDLQTLLEQAISSALEDFPDEIPDGPTPAALTLNYRDPDYSATTGGITLSRSA